MRFISSVVCALAAVLVPGWAHGDISKESRVEYTSLEKDNQDLTVWLPDGKATGSRPCVILVHGGGWLMGSRMQLRTYGEEFAKAGYVTASVSYRMMSDYAFPYCLYDVKTAIRYLRSHAAEYGIDPERMVIFGESAGGHLAGLAAVTQPKDGFEGPGDTTVSSAVQAAIIFYGAVDLTQWKNAGEDGGRMKKGLKKFMDDFLSREYPDVADPYAHGSPVTYVDAGDPPTLFVHGTADGLVDIKQSKAMYEALKAKGVTTDFIEVGGAGHGFDHFSPSTRKEVFALILQWLDTNLKPASV